MDGRACTLDELIEDAKRLADSIPTNLSLTKTSIGKAELYTISPTPSPTLEHAKPSTFKSSVRNAFPLFVEEGPSDLIGKEAPQKINFPTIPKRGVAMTKTITSPKGVYYKCGHEGERVPVAVGDLVVRVHNKVENETEDNNKWNILDGPFRIVKFDRSNRIWTCSNEGDEHMNNMKYMVAKRAQWNKMLKTKVQLSFSDKSYGPTGIEIGTLLPCFDGIIIGATLLSNSLTVSQMPIFTKVQELLKENVVSQGGEAPSSLRLQEQANLYFVELKKGTFIAVAEVKREGPLVKQGLYEVERLRAKRLRRLNPNQEAVLAHGLSTEWNDPWVQRLQREHPELFPGKVVVPQYLVHWAGWPSEDDTWEYASERESPIPGEFIDEYNKFADPLRNLKP